jgi:hypothetical protein
MEATQMNAAWQLGYEDGKAHRARLHESGPVAIVGIVAYDYSMGYKAGNGDAVWVNGNRPPQAE